MDYSDLLDETVAADDITGRNACPIWNRITAIGQYPMDQRVSIMNGSRNTFIKSGRGRGYKAIRVWVEVDGEIIDKEQIAHLCDIIPALGNTLQKHRQAAIELGKNETITKGFRWGWYNS